MQIDQLELRSSEPMPVLFVGHGSPMNAIEENEFTESWKQLGETMPKPQAILCISAHWETRGTYLTAMDKPRTIHDFGGFPKPLYEVEYPAAGFPELAASISQDVANVGLDRQEWGFDHGSWSVIRHIYPEANIPMLELSIDHFMKPERHYELAQELAYLRSKGVLIVGSGNIVHNLREVNWYDENAEADWALEVREKVNTAILNQDHQFLIDFRKQNSAFQRAIPTAEHYLPMLYALALQTPKDQVRLFNDKIVMGSLSMTGIYIGA